LRWSSRGQVPRWHFVDRATTTG